MVNVVANEYYEAGVEPSKNRLYIKVIGFWKNPEQVPNYVSDLRTAAEKLEPGFTILVDLRMMKPPATSVTPVHVEAQQMLVEHGLSRTAEVVGNAVLLELQLKKFAQESAMIKAEFNTPEEGEKWLDNE